MAEDGDQVDNLDSEFTYTEEGFSETDALVEGGGDQDVDSSLGLSGLDTEVGEADDSGAAATGTGAGGVDDPVSGPLSPTSIVHKKPKHLGCLGTF